MRAALIVVDMLQDLFGTDLDTRLTKVQPDILVLAGVNTHACVRMTAIDAYQRDYDVVVAS